MRNLIAVLSASVLLTLGSAVAVSGFERVGMRFVGALQSGGMKPLLIPSPQEQPMAFDHLVHREHGVKCDDCHKGVALGGPAGIPNVSDCLDCHLRGPFFEATPVRVPAAEIPFSHSVHVQGEDMDCAECHGKDKTAPKFPEAAVCLDCHDEDSDSEGPLGVAARALVALGGKGSAGFRLWAPLGEGVQFSHGKHTAADCRECHDDAAQRGTRPGRDTSFPMGRCADCHARNSAPTNCTACHPGGVGDAARIAKEMEEVEARNLGGASIRWIQRTHLPKDIHFPHRNHVEYGRMTCEECHGETGLLPESPKVGQQYSMDNCINCHAERKVTNDCLACHR